MNLAIVCIFFVSNQVIFTYVNTGRSKADQLRMVGMTG